MPIDALWFRLPRGESAPETPGYLGGGQIILTINRGEYWQCGAIIDKDGFESVKGQGLAAFRSNVAAAAPFLAASLGALTDWDQVKLLSVRANPSRRDRYQLRDRRRRSHRQHTCRAIGEWARQRQGPAGGAETTTGAHEDGPATAGCPDCEPRPNEQDRPTAVDVAVAEPIRTRQTTTGPGDGARFPPRTHPDRTALRR